MQIIEMSLIRELELFVHLTDLTLALCSSVNVNLGLSLETHMCSIDTRIMTISFTEIATKTSLSHSDLAFSSTVMKYSTTFSSYNLLMTLKQCDTVQVYKEWYEG